MKRQELKVFQSNKFTESRQEFTLNEKRVMQFIIAKIKPIDTEFIEYVLPISEIADMANITADNMYKFGKTLMISMIGKFILLEDEKTQRAKAFNYFHHIDYHNGEITIQLHEYVHHLFLELKKDKINFTAYELTEFMTLTSTYAQRIYELLKQYNRSKNRERTIELKELRNMLAIEENKYTRFGNFRVNILELAHKLIEENTTLRYKWEATTKRGRKIHSIRFYEIHTAGKESPTELQEQAFIENYIGQEIYNEELSSYFTISEIKKEEENYIITDKETNIAYSYKNLEALQESIAKAIMHKI